MGVTFKEYAWLINPNLLKNSEIGGVKGCPEGYGFEEHWCDGHGMISCADCWNREISYPVIAEVIRDTYLNPFEKITVGAKYKVTDVDMGAPTLGVMICVSGYNHWANNNNFRYYIDKEADMNKEFTKADLKDGMIVVARNGEKALVLGNRIIFKDGFNRFDEYKDDLMIKVNVAQENYDIVKVYVPDISYISSISRILGAPEEKVLFERAEEKEISSEEAFSVLKEHYGCDVKIKE